MNAAITTLTEHPQILLGILLGIVITAVIHAIRRIRRLITTGLVLAIAGGAVTGLYTTDALQNLLHLH